MFWEGDGWVGVRELGMFIAWDLIWRSGMWGLGLTEIWDIDVEFELGNMSNTLLLP